MLYNDTVTKETLLVVKGWAETVSATKNTNLTSIKNQVKKEELNVQKQLLDEILLSSSLADTLSKTHNGACIMAIKKGDDPSLVADSGHQFKVTDLNGKTSRVSLPVEWQRSLCAMYSMGFDQAPNPGAKTVQALDHMIAQDPIDRTKAEDRFTTLDAKAGAAFLKEMKACMVDIRDKANPGTDASEKQVKLEIASQQNMKSIYGSMPKLSGSELDPEVKAISSEYGPAPTPGKGKGGSNDDDDGDAV